MMNDTMQTTEWIVEKYKQDVTKMAYYLPWLEKKSGNDVSHLYQGDGVDSKTFSFPVYDSTLLSFVNDASMTVFMDQNYRYIYSRYRIKNFQDEWNVIAKADIRTMDILCGILSKYVLGGMTKSILWKEGVEYQIFLRIFKKAKEIIEYWDIPLDVQGESPLENLILESEEENLIEENLTEVNLIEEDLTTDIWE